MYLGTDTSTVTTHELVQLINPIGVSPGTPPNTTSGEGLTMVSDGHWRIAFMATWNPGTISGAVGEVALYLGMPLDLTPGTEIWRFAQVMVSRCAVADGDFSQFTIDASKSLIVLWEVFIRYE